MYFSGPWENILTLWQCLKFYYFKLQISLTLPYLTNLEPPSQPCRARGHQIPPSAALKLNFQHVVSDDLFKKLPKLGIIKSGTAIVL